MQYLFVHGSWTGAWCWEPFVPLLKAKGHKVDCIDLPGHGENQKPASEVTYKDYYSFLENKLLAYKEPVILVAHSFSAIIAAPLADRHPDKIRHLYLVTCWIAQDGKSMMDVAVTYGYDSEIVNILQFDAINKTHILTNTDLAKEIFFHDCSPEIRDWAGSKLQPQPSKPMETPIEWVDSGKTKDKRTYVFCEFDRAITPSTQRDMVKQLPSKTVSIQSGHFPFLSQPQKFLEVITATI